MNTNFVGTVFGTTAETLSVSTFTVTTAGTKWRSVLCRALLANIFATEDLCLIRVDTVQSLGDVKDLVTACCWIRRALQDNGSEVGSNMHRDKPW